MNAKEKIVFMVVYGAELFGNKDILLLFMESTMDNRLTITGQIFYSL